MPYLQMEPTFAFHNLRPDMTFLYLNKSMENVYEVQYCAPIAFDILVNSIYVINCKNYVEVVKVHILNQWITNTQTKKFNILQHLTWFGICSICAHLILMKNKDDISCILDIYSFHFFTYQTLYMQCTNDSKHTQK